MNKNSQLVTWYKLDEKRPREGDIVLVTISGHRFNKRITYDHAFALASWFDDEGFLLENDYLDEFTIHAWCDVTPFNPDEVKG